MAEDVSSVVARRFRNATEPITEISLNVDGGCAYAKREGDTRIYSGSAIRKISALEVAVRFATNGMRSKLRWHLILGGNYVQMKIGVAVHSRFIWKNQMSLLIHKRALHVSASIIV